MHHLIYDMGTITVQYIWKYMLPYENIYVDLLGTIVLLIQSIFVLLHQPVKQWWFSVYFSNVSYVIRHHRTKYTWIYFKTIINQWTMRLMQADIMAMDFAELIQA
jgi:hypothetical protein